MVEKGPYIECLGHGLNPDVTLDLNQLLYTFLRVQYQQTSWVQTLRLEGPPK